METLLLPGNTVGILKHFLKIYYLFIYMHWCFVCLYVCGRVPDPLKLVLQTKQSFHVDAGN